MRWVMAAILALVPVGALAQTWHEPARGSDERRALVDALRPHAEWLLGAPVEFVVDEMRASGDRAFAMFTAQRPGGGAIDLRTTPMAARGDYEPELGDALQFQALYQRSGDTWVAVQWANAATDVWWIYTPFCEAWDAVIADYCGQ